MAAVRVFASRPPASSRAPGAQRPTAVRAPVAVVARRASPPAAARYAAAPRPGAAPATPLPPPRRDVVRRAGPSGQEAEGRFDISEEEKLSQDFDYLGNKVKDTTDLLNPELKGCSLYLIGMMGSGKSTVGRMLANTLRRARALCVLLLQLLSLPLLSLPRSLLRSLSPLPLYLVDGWYAFFDTDGVIEKAHPGMTIADIFREHGEEYFRKCEAQVLKELAPYKNLVVSTGGGAVTSPMNWSYMHNGIVCWLEGPSDLLARRVVAEGVEKRPLLYGDGVTAENAYEVAHGKLQALLEAREKYYENADVRVPLDGVAADEETGAPAAVVMYRLLTRVLERIEATKAEREARKNFTIEGLGPKAAAGGGGGAAQQQQAAEE